MRSSLFLVPFSLLIACDEPGKSPVEQSNVPQPSIAITDTSVVVDNNAVQLVPLTNAGVKFNGVYHYASGSLHYYMRFFERGNAAFVGGNEKYDGQLAEMLTIDVKSGWNQVHNCPVIQRNDSLFMRSMGIKGAINYLGEVRANGDSVRFLKASEITGTRIIGAYAFLPDSYLQQEKAKFVEPK
jgi:hypothetical protein